MSRRQALATSPACCHHPQTGVAWAVGAYALPWWQVLAIGYAIGPYLAGALLAGYHEIGHFLVFEKPSWNKVGQVHR